MNRITRLREKGGVGEVVATIMIAGLVVALIVAIIYPIARTAWEEGKKTKERQNQIGPGIEDMVEPQ